MRVSRLLSSLLVLLATLSLQAQVEPNLQTTTDLADVYQSKSASSTLVLILDTTAASRGVFESPDYLTSKARGSFLGPDTALGKSPQPPDVTANTVFVSPGRPNANLSYITPILGYVFGMRNAGGASAEAEVRMYTWPSGAPLTVRTSINANTEVIGTPYCYSGPGTAMTKVLWQTDILTTLKNAGNPVTHIRFTINGRTIDLPCPWKIHDSPASFVAQPPVGTKTAPFPTIQVYQRNFQKNVSFQSGYAGIPYDAFSDVPSNQIRTIISYPDPIMGQFYYSPDYLAWIFYGKSVRGPYSLVTSGPDKAGQVEWKANTYGYFGGYAVPTISDNVTISNGVGGTASGKGEGFANHLPNMNRLQAQKVAIINAFLDKIGLAKWYYRFLAPTYSDTVPGLDHDEELVSTAWSTPSVYRPDDDLSAPTNPRMLSDLRELTLPLLKAAAPPFAAASNITSLSALQQVAPRDMVGTQIYKNTAYDFGGDKYKSFDAYTPEPVAVALANTYRKIIKDETKFSTGSCTGGVFVVILPANGMNDSYLAIADQLSADNGSGGYLKITSGAVGTSPDSTWKNPSMIHPDTTTSSIFHPGVLGWMAAHGVTGRTSNDNNNYEAPWMHTVTDTAGITTFKTRKIQTMTISLAVPGSFVLKNDGNGRNPHEEFFLAAAWSNPIYDTWASRTANKNGNGDLLYYYAYTNDSSVRYFPVADPAALEQVISNIGSFVVYGKAALSAPATPATGVQNANQAYFGTFQTTATISDIDKVPVWSGNLYAIGLKRTTISGATASSVQNVFQFYGINDTSLAYGTVNNSGNNTADFDVLNLWSAYTIFGRYQAATHNTTNTAKILGGTGLSWRNRRAYIFNNNGTSSTNNKFEPYLHSANVLSGSDPGTAQLDNIMGWINVKDPTNKYSLSTAITAGTLPTYNTTRNMMRFLLGAYDPTEDGVLLNRDKLDKDPITNKLLHHLNIMGDIVNSAPQAVELSKGLADTLPAVVTGDPFYTEAYSSAYTDPHTRLIIVGTNTGNLHCFVEVAALNTSNGFYRAKATELWTVIPPNLFPMLWDLYNYRTTTDTSVYKHHYGVDGDPVLFHVDRTSTNSVLGDTRVGVKEDAAIIFSFRKGARDYFALKLADSSDAAITPAIPHLAWWIKPITGDIVTPSGTDSSKASLLKTMGMSTSVLTFGYVRDSSSNLKHVAFITGGYSNTEVDTRYKNDDDIAGTTFFANGMGRLILGLNPMTGANVRTIPWDFRGVSINGKPVGAIAGGVAPVEILSLGTGLTHRIYFGDLNGNVFAINADKTATNSTFRLDDEAINTWYASDKIRPVYSDPKVKFTTAPDAFRLAGDFPVMQKVSVSGIETLVRPITVMASIGSGDRNNPVDAPEDFSYINKSAVTKTITLSNYAADPMFIAGNKMGPADYNRLYVFADTQNAPSTGRADGDLKSIESSWATSYSDAKVTPGSSTYLWGYGSNYYYGYYIDLPHNGATNPLLVRAGNSPNYTRDKVLVSPLLKEGSLFYSFYNVYGSSGYSCSPFSTTRTFRQCDITRPLYSNPQLNVNCQKSDPTGANYDPNCTKVGDVTALNKNADGCSGLAFAFNSLSSQLVDAGDYVMQGGAKTNVADTLAPGSNTPDIQAVKDTGANKGFRLKSWRIIR